MDTKTRLRQLLTAFLIDQDDLIHDGRVMSRPPMESTIEAIEALFAPQQDTLTQVLMSSTELIGRFPGGELTERGTFAKFAEESDELKKAIYECQSVISYSFPDNDITHARNQVASELIDVCVTAGGMAALVGLTTEDILNAAQHVIDKNNLKTTDTHRWDDASKTIVKIVRFDS